MNQEQTVITHTTGQFYCTTDNNGNIYTTQGYNNNILVGVSLQKYQSLEKMLNEALEKAEKYESQLVEAGILKPVLTQEQQLELMTAQISSLTSSMAEIANTNKLLMQQLEEKKLDEMTKPSEATNA